MMIKSKNLFLLFFLYLVIVSCSGKKLEKIEVDRFLFGTNVKIVIYSENKEKATKLIDDTFEIMEKISEKYNSKDNSSIVYKLNENPKSEIAIDKDFHEMIDRTTKLSDLTKGSFDITIGPLMSIWGFDDLDIKEVPKQEKIDEVKKLVNYKDIILTTSTIKMRNSNQRIDTGSFLKGYAIEKGIEFLKANGIKNAMITAISSIGTIGEKPDNKPFRIGVQNPKKPDSLLYVLELNNKALGVAGDYQTFVEIGGKKYHHILDAKTGYPSDYNSMVLVLCDDVYTADLYDTAFFLMKPQEILYYVSKKKNMEVFVVDKNGKEYFSKNMKNYLSK